MYYFSAVEHHFLKQRPQQLFEAWSRQSERVAAYFVEPPRRPSAKPRPAATERIVRSAFYLPFEHYGLSAFEPLNHAFMHRALGPRPPGTRRVAIASSAFFEPFLRRADFDLIAYDFLDALDVHGAGRDHAWLLERHRQLLSSADIVFVTAERLREEAASAGREAIWVSNGVDDAFFQAHRYPSPVDSRRGGRPTVGYVGALYRWIDLGLIFRTAAHMPEVDFILVGPLDPHLSGMVAERPSNVHLLGQRDYADVPRYIEAFDVALIPFHGDAVAESTDPIKLYEYFALGKPVVATPMRQLSPYAEAGLLATAASDEDFSAGIARFLAHDAPEHRAYRMAIASANAWTAKAEVMLAAIERHLQQKAAPCA